MSRVQGTRNVQLKAIKQKLHQHQLVDIWRIQHPRTQDYTFYSPVHGTYTRIDYWLIEHRMLDLVVSTNIEITTLSDHAPMTMKIKIPETQIQAYSWRLNEDLLDKQGEEIIKKELEQYFSLNGTSEIADDTLWEAHKAYIRGILISMGTRRKKERIKKRAKLIEEIYLLEQRHKKGRGQDQELSQELVIKRDELKELLEQEIRKTFNKISKERYQWGNKNSKCLARMLRKKNQ